MQERSKNIIAGTLKQGNSASATPLLHSPALKSTQMKINSKNIITFVNCKVISGLKQKCQAIAGHKTIICKVFLGQDISICNVQTVPETYKYLCEILYSAYRTVRFPVPTLCVEALKNFL